MKTFFLHKTTTTCFCKWCSYRIWHLPSARKRIQPFPGSQNNSHSISKEKQLEKSKMLSSKSAHRAALCQGVFVAFSHIRHKTGMTVALLGPRQLAFPAFLDEGSRRDALTCIELGGENGLCVLLFREASIFISGKETSTGGKRGFRPCSNHLHWHLT